MMKCFHKLIKQFLIMEIEEAKLNCVDTKDMEVCGLNAFRYFNVISGIIFYSRIWKQIYKDPSQLMLMK